MKDTDQKINRSGIPIDEVYWPDDSNEKKKAQSNLGKPGEYPFTRGVKPNMYRGRLWTMRQYAGFGTAEEANQRYHYLLNKGTTGLSVAFDLPTQLGLDPDHPRSRGEVGKVGVSISTLDDMRTLFKGIDPSQVSTSMTINATSNVLLALYVAMAEEKGVDSKALRGTVQNDVLKEYVARGNYIYPPQGALRLATDLFGWCTEHTPLWNPISISGYHIREAGSTAVQELAFTFANAITYVDAAIERGLAVDDFAGRLSFFFNVHNDFFEEIAKFRAARRIWAKLMKEKFGAKNPRSWTLRFHSQTAGSTLTAQQPQNNVVRVALQAMASVLGGTQSLHTNSLDEALALPTEETAQIALRTQQVIAHESGVVQTVDPLGGSWFVEKLTSEIESRTHAYLKEIEKRGGTIRCIEEEYIQNEILDSAYRDQRSIDQGELKVVGVNCFQEEKDASASVSADLLKVPPELEAGAVERIQAYRNKRNSKETEAALRNLKEAVNSGDQLQPQILNSVRSGATLGEISDVLRDEFGEYRPG